MSASFLYLWFGVKRRGRVLTPISWLRSLMDGSAFEKLTVSCRHIVFEQLWGGKGFVHSFMI